MPSLTWQFLPQYLLEPVMQQHLTLAEASEIWDHSLVATEEEWEVLPPHLWSAAERLMLLEMEISETQH